MAKTIKATEVISGTFGEVWLNGEYVAEVRAFQAKVEFKKEEVPRVGVMMSGHKIMGMSGNGSIKMYKIDSKLGKLLTKTAKEGKVPDVVIITKLNDPDARGSERVAIKGVSFNDLTLADWEVGSITEIEATFTFDDFDYLDQI